MIFIPFVKTNAQALISAGGFAGGGYISGNLPSQGSFTSSLFVEAKTQPIFGFDSRLSFLFVSDFDKLLPRTSIQYYPFLKGFSLKGIVYQPVSNIFYIEEGIGPMMLNDRSLVDLNKWNLGLAFSILAGTNFGDPLSIIRLGAGIEYGLTFTNTDVRYSSFHLQVQISL